MSVTGFVVFGAFTLLVWGLNKWITKKVPASEVKINPDAVGVDPSLYLVRPLNDGKFSMDMDMNNMF